MNSEALCYRHVAFDVHAINRLSSYVLLGEAFQAWLQSLTGCTACLIKIQRYASSSVKRLCFESLSLVRV